MKTRGQNRYDADRMAAAEDELSFALRSLDDLEEEHRAGNVSDEQFERLHGEYVVRAADAARAQQRESKLRTRATPRRRRTRLVLVAALAVAGTGTALAVQGGSSPRAAGQTITGNASLGTASAVNTGPLNAAAQAAMTKGDLAGALKSYLAAIDADPRDVEALTYAGWISYLGGVADKSLTLLDAAVRVDPSYPDAHAFRGIVLFKARHDRAGAMAELRSYLRLVPDGQMSGQVRAVLTQVQKS